mmetsp:Transcript_95012/g.130762  ORF Transcript_95012/g.130762 Transcript_95012/m.130762 type:complete len:267 (-) Transcript_95012:6-806(-)
MIQVIILLQKIYFSVKLRFEVVEMLSKSFIGVLYMSVSFNCTEPGRSFGQASSIQRLITNVEKVLQFIVVSQIGNGQVFAEEIFLTLSETVLKLNKQLTLDDINLAIIFSLLFLMIDFLTRFVWNLSVKSKFSQSVSTAFNHNENKVKVNINVLSFALGVKRVCALLRLANILEEVCRVSNKSSATNLKSNHLSSWVDCFVVLVATLGEDIVGSIGNILETADVKQVDHGSDLRQEHVTVKSDLLLLNRLAFFLGTSLFLRHILDL